MRTPMAWIALASIAEAGAVWACGGGAKACDGEKTCADEVDASAEGPRDDDARETDRGMRDSSKSEGKDVAVDEAAPRPIAPLSTARVTSQTPTLRWALPRGVSDATVDLCLDRACTLPLGTPAHVTGTSYAPTSALPVGVVYWRLHPSTVLSVTSPTWQFTVGARSAPIDASWGTTLDVNGDGYADLAVGAPGASSSVGNVDIYLGGASGLARVPLTLGDPGEAAGDAFGHTVASAGDVNGDGYADLVVGAPGVSESTGSVYVYLGGPSGLGTVPVTLDNPNGREGDLFGQSVTSAGDVNGDGYADLAVAAPGASVSAGSVYVYVGGPSGLDPVPTLLNDPANTSSNPLGSSVAGAGDVNGDGYGDLVVGASGLATSTGEVDVYLGGPSGLGTTPTTLNDPANTAGDSFGGSVAGAGDVNGDGYGDLIVGARGTPNSTGGAYIYYGGSSGIGSLPTALNDPGGTLGDSFGLSVACAGDVNGDGYADLVVGAYSTESGTGHVYVFVGGPPSPLGPLVATLVDPAPMAAGGFGVFVASAGDVTGDGYAGVVVGVDGAPTSSGSVYVYPGGMPDLGAAVSVANTSDAGSQFGASVFGATN